MPLTDHAPAAQRVELRALAVPLLHAVVVPQRVREDVRGLDAAQLAPVLAGAAAHIASPCGAASTPLGGESWGCRGDGVWGRRVRRVRLSPRRGVLSLSRAAHSARLSSRPNPNGVSSPKPTAR